MSGDEGQVKRASAQLGAGIKEQKTEELKSIIQRSTQKAVSPKDALGLTDAMIEGIYGQAYRLYNTGKYKDASQLFRMLVMINTTEAKYTMGLAACFHMLKDYKNAADTYSIVGMIDPQSPISFYHASDCYVKMGDIPSATVALEMAVKRAGSKPEFRTLKDRAAMTLESLKKELEKVVK